METVNETETANATDTDDVTATQDGYGGCVGDVCRRYGDRNVVLLGCRHYRIMDGETDVVKERVRSDGAEEAVIRMVKAVGNQPDWFVDHWDEDGERMLSALLFELEEDACRFREEMAKEDAARKERGCAKAADVWLVRDDDWTEHFARHFNEEWEKAHEEIVRRNERVIADAEKEHADWVRRIVIAEFADEGRMKEVGNVIQTRMDCEIPYCPCKDEATGSIVVGFACDDAKQTGDLMSVLDDKGVEWRMLRDAETETEKQVGALLLAKLDQRRMVDEKMAEMRKDAGGKDA